MGNSVNRVNQSHAQNTDVAVDSAMSQAEYASYRGVSKVTVTKWKKRGVLVLDDAGRVLVNSSDAELLRHGLGEGFVPPQPALEEPEETDIDDDDEVVGEEMTDAEIAMSMLMSADNMDIGEGKRMKEVYRGFLNKVEYERKAGNLVPKADVIALFRDRWSTERKALEDWPSKAGPGLAGRFGIDPIAFRVALEEAVHAFLTERSTTPDVSQIEAPPDAA